MSGESPISERREVDVRQLDRLSVEALRGVGGRLATRLAAIGITTVQDLLFHLPRRYEDRTRVTPIGALRPGGQAVVEADVELTEVRFGRRRSLLIRVADGTGGLTIRLFHFSAAQQQAFARGSRFRFFGDVRSGPVTLEMVHPEYRRVVDDAPVTLEDRLTPIYPATEGLSQQSLRRLTSQVLDMLDRTTLPDWLPSDLLKQFRFSELHAALRYVHRPPPGAALDVLEEGRHPAQQRLAFEELLAHHLSLRRLRDQAQCHEAPPLHKDSELCRRLVADLPFPLTRAQQRVIDEIGVDLERSRPMMRLVQGDVGAGKTVVAVAAALAAVAAGYQVAVMAPTELLAEQHVNNFRHWLAPSAIEVGWLSGKVKGRRREAQLAAAAQGDTAILIGTHALFQENVLFNRLGLVIIDEQHRFGVHQRLSLRAKGAGNGRQPHQLIMTATPIPRTLAMTFYADLDISVIDELPPGRTPVQTVVVPDSRRHEVIERVRQACREGRQAYWVCTLIDESDALQCQAAEDTFELLSGSLPGLRVGLIHGRLKAAEKAGRMAAFKAGELDLLVATTVIEVGVDVPNATLMIIENAERLGLAQLHQLRGRVGRGHAVSSCVLMYKGGLSQQSRARLNAMRETNDGFEIARRDLELRGPGEVLGTRQTGDMRFQIADLLRDAALLEKVEAAAGLLATRYPDHVDPLIRRWLGDAAVYGNV